MNSTAGRAGRKRVVSFCLFLCTLPFWIWATDSLAAGVKRKVIISDPKLSEELAAQGGEFIADYGSFQWWAAPEEVAAPLASRNGAQLAVGEDSIELGAGPIDTAAPSKQSAESTESF